MGQDVPYAAMGGLTGFSSLADGYIRLDPSGRGNQSIDNAKRISKSLLQIKKKKGRPEDDFFDAPISNKDHPMLRQFAHSDMARNSRGELELTDEARSAMRRPNESEMDYYERRYQERVSVLNIFIRNTKN